MNYRIWNFQPFGFVDFDQSRDAQQVVKEYDGIVCRVKTFICRLLLLAITSFFQISYVL